MIKRIVNLFSKKDKKPFDRMELDCFKLGPYANEIEKLRFELRRAEGCIKHLNKRLDLAHEIMNRECVGIYKYTETPEKRFQKRLELASSNLQHRGDMAVKRIYRFIGLPDPKELKTEKINDNEQNRNLTNI